VNEDYIRLGMPERHCMRVFHVMQLWYECRMDVCLRSVSWRMNLGVSVRCPAWREARVSESLISVVDPESLLRYVQPWVFLLP